PAFNRLAKIIVTVCGLGAANLASAGTVEVLHWWTSGGEAAAAAELKQMLEAKGHEWQDFAVAGGGGESAMTALKSRVISGNPPGAAQIKGPAIQQWGDTGTLADLDPVAESQNWDELLPPVVARVMQYDDQYVAAPVNVHRVNWMWANPAVFEQAGAEIPTTWDEFVAAAEKIQAAGFIPVAHGGQAWQDSTTFESVVLAVGGADLYNRAFVELDEAALTSDEMVEAFRRLRQIKSFTDPNAPGRDWNLATSMVINGEAAMQFMGDWAKGEFTAAGQAPGEDYVCQPFPGTDGAFTFNIDSFVMFAVSGDDREAQLALAETILEQDFQRLFNQAKGSIPVRTDMAMDGFDQCARESMEDFKEAATADTLVPSMAHGMSTFPAVQGAIYDVVTNFYNSDMVPEQAAEELARGVAAAEPSL
ncbi:MAG: ABC transporter substrate-binding protein, partial [Candidatus Competibacterales bacterium]|nr:ABC transporter substrate-binding protein [Candidatus Competibacterales bacterium]